MLRSIASIYFRYTADYFHIPVFQVQLYEILVLTRPYRHETSTSSDEEYDMNERP